MKDRVQAVNHHHRKAMEYVDQSFVARRYGEREKYLHYTRLAFEKEAAAADLMVDKLDIEPTRSVLHRSAATLAWRCEMYDEAKRLIYRAKSGYPPPYIDVELDDLLGKVQLALTGSHLSENELVMTLEGSQVLPARVPATAVDRMASVQNLISIMARARIRKNGMVLELSKCDENYPLYLEHLSAGSANIHLRIGHVKNDEMLPGFDLDDTCELMTQLMDNLRVHDQGDYNALRQAISNLDDFNDFRSAAHKLAPDGEFITSVNLQTRIRGEVSYISLNQTNTEVNEEPIPNEPEGDDGYLPTEEEVRKEGKLKIANLLKKSECVLDTENEGVWHIEGTEELITSIGKKYLNERIVVQGKRMKKKNKAKRILIERNTDVKKLRRLL